MRVWCISILTLWVSVFFFLALLICIPAHARDLGQWENTDPAVHEWYRTLQRPDQPGICCTEADAYWADEVHVRGGKTFATITDDRDDGPLRRPHIPNGTEIEIPDSKLKWDKGNPTGHNILFMSVNHDTYCFVMGSGT
jgi:hypothetical protein